VLAKMGTVQVGVKDRSLVMVSVARVVPPCLMQSWNRAMLVLMLMQRTAAAV